MKRETIQSLLKQLKTKGKMTPKQLLGNEELILEAIEKLGVEYQFDEFSQRSLNGESLQVPASFKIMTNSRFKRKIVVNNSAINAS